MSDMWAAASKDIEAEHKERGTAMAAVALGNFAPFLFEAKSRGDFNTRVALQQERIAAALVEATEIEECRKEALDQMTADFDQVLATRQAEAKVAAKRAESKAKAKSVVAKSVQKAAAQPTVVYSIDGARVVDLGEGNPIAPRYKIEKDFGDGAFGFVSFSDDLDAAKAAADGQQKVATKVARKRPTDKTALHRHTAADEISAGDYIVASGGLPDLREVGAPKIMITTNRPQKVVKIETLEDAFEREFDHHGVVDAADILEDWLGQDIPGRASGNPLTNAWVAHLESGAIVPLDVQGVFSSKFPTRGRAPQVPGQKSWNLASRQEAERLPMRIRMAAQAEERLPMQIHMANPYSNGNPYSNTNPPAAAPAPQVTVNVAPPEDKPVVDDDDERQRRTRDKINQTQMTQDLTASQRTLQTTLARKIKRQYPHVTAQQAMKVAKATMEAHPGLVHHAVSRLPQGGRETSTKESSSR